LFWKSEIARYYALLGDTRLGGNFVKGDSAKLLGSNETQVMAQMKLKLSEFVDEWNCPVCGTGLSVEKHEIAWIRVSAESICEVTEYCKNCHFVRYDIREFYEGVDEF
jgi:rubredoxin